MEENYGCNLKNGLNCRFVSNIYKMIRLVLTPNITSNVPRLTSEQIVLQPDVTLPKFPCTNIEKFVGKIIRAAGDWSPLPLWNAMEPLGLMNYDDKECRYTVVLNNLVPQKYYIWKVKKN